MIAPAPIQNTTRPHKTALIVEGGAMRGAWAAGVLAFLHERGHRQFDAVYAASSGACCAAYFVAGMVESGLNIWGEHVSGRKLVRKSNLLRLKPVIDLAYLIDNVFKKTVPLSIETIQKAPTQFYIVLTDCASGEPHYFHARDERIFDALRATASMPYATRGYAHVDGKPYADGGLSDPIPLQRAVAEGATDVTVVLTHNSQFRLQPSSQFWRKLAYRKFPAVGEAWVTQHARYNAALDLMATPPEGVRIRVFRPIRPMTIGTFTRAPKRLIAALAIGKEEARQQAPPSTIVVAETVKKTEAQ